MSDYWYLCGDTGVIKYAGKFEDFDDVTDHMDSMSGGDRSVWIFSELPKVETPVGGEYNLVVGDTVTVSLVGANPTCEASVIDNPDGIKVKVDYYEL